VTPEVATYCEQQLTRIRESGALAVFEDAGSVFRDALPTVLAASDFVGAALTRDLSPGDGHTDGRLSRWLIDEAALTRVLAAGEMARRLQAAVAHEPDVAGFMAALRRHREREMVRIAWRDLAGWAQLQETLADTTAFADAAIEAAVEFAGRDLARMYGEPRNVAGNVQPFIVLGMGKLGGGELNFSSDIDLIFLFPEKGTTSGSRCIDNEDFFTRLGRLVIRLLGEPTADGIVFRVDMRLRPFGDSGPLAVSAAFLDNYLQAHGRDWERYAWIKARAITGVAAYKIVQAESVRPFVYRRYLDFGVFESLREMKALHPEGSRAPRARRTREARTRWHPRNRIRRAGLSAHTRRTGSPHADAVAARRAAAARRRQAAACTGGARARGGLCVPAAARESPADAGRHPGPHRATGCLTRERLAVAMGFDGWAACAPSSDRHRACVTHAFQDVIFARNEAVPAEMPGVNGIAEAWVRGPTSRSSRQRSRPEGLPTRPRGAQCSLNSAGVRRCAGSTRPAARASTC
jgi:glutamate-ammonia-ligase adenylyltransferase